jgi:hypothetical protein
MKIRMELLMTLYVYVVFDLIFDKDCIGLSARKSTAYF